MKSRDMLHETCNPFLQSLSNKDYHFPHFVMLCCVTVLYLFSISILINNFLHVPLPTIFLLNLKKKIVLKHRPKKFSGDPFDGSKGNC